MLHLAAVVGDKRAGDAQVARLYPTLDPSVVPFELLLSSPRLYALPCRTVLFVVRARSPGGKLGVSVEAAHCLLLGQGLGPGGRCARLSHWLDQAALVQLEQQLHEHVGVLLHEGS